MTSFRKIVFVALCVLMGIFFVSIYSGLTKVMAQASLPTPQVAVSPGCIDDILPNSISVVISWSPGGDYDIVLWDLLSGGSFTRRVASGTTSLSIPGNFGPSQLHIGSWRVVLFDAPNQENSTVTDFQISLCPVVIESSTPTPAPTVTITSTPSPSPSISPTPSLACDDRGDDNRCLTPTPSASQTPSPTITSTPTPTPRLNIIQTQSQSQSTGPIRVEVIQESAPAPAVRVVTSSNAKGGTQVKQLPKTGPELATWLISGLLPFGVAMRRFGTIPGGYRNFARFMTQKRGFDKE